MVESEAGGAGATRAVVVAVFAVLGLLFSSTPLSERLDDTLLDWEWSTLRQFALRPAPEDIVIVGLDEATHRAIALPPGLWHEPLGRALVRIASAHPRAIGLDTVLPEHSADAVKPGLDRILMLGLAAARSNGPFVATLGIDPRTRSAKPIHPPFLAMMSTEGLGIGLLARDRDGTTRRFSLVLPTEDGGFPTLEGRLCRALTRNCSDGFIHYALGQPFRYVSLEQVLEMPPGEAFDRLFQGRIVLIGETQAQTDRVEVPVNYAGWETARRDSPAVVVHAQALRTALLGMAPSAAAKPIVLVLATLAALILLMRDWRLVLPVAVPGAVALYAGGALALRGGTVVPLSAAFVTLGVASLAHVVHGMRSMKRGPKVQAHRADAAFLCVRWEPAAGAVDLEAGALLAAFERGRDAIGRIARRHRGTLVESRAGEALVAFESVGARPRARAAAREIISAFQELNTGAAIRLAVAMGADYGNAALGDSRGRTAARRVAIGAAAERAADLAAEALRERVPLRESPAMDEPGP